MAGAGRVAAPDLLLQEAGGIQVAGPHGAVGLVVGVTAAEVDLVQVGLLERQRRGCRQLVRG